MVLCHDVTEKVIAKRKLEQSEQQVRAIIEAAPFPIGIYTGPEMRIELVNQSIIDTWGKGPDITGKTFTEVLPEFKDADFPKQLAKVYQSGQAFSARNQRVEFINEGQKEIKYFNYDYTPLFDAGGKVYGVMNTAAEVTDLHKAKEKVEESEQRVRSIILSSPSPVAVYMGREMRIEIANQSIIDIWGKGNDVIGKTYYELLPELESQNIYPLLDEVFTSGKAFHAHNQPIMLVAEGKERQFYFNYSFTPLFDSEGKVYGVMNTAADVTDLNIAKRRVEESEQNLRNMILQAPVAMCILEGDEHTITVANDLMIELWGKPKEAVMGKPVFEALPDAREQGLEELMAMVYRKRRNLQGQRNAGATLP
jgi:PAS domain S-box-containing protein